MYVKGIVFFFTIFLHVFFAPMMKKKININHLRVIKKFSQSDNKFKISDYEKFLIDYVSVPTARKIIKDLIELNIVSIIKSESDLRVKYLVVNDTDIEKYL